MKKYYLFLKFMILYVVIISPCIVYADDAQNIKYILPNSVIKKYNVSLPKILSDDDLKLYYDIFTLQRKQANYNLADKLIKKLQDKSLLGYVYYERYEAKKYVATPKQLIEWMQKYYDLPVASDIYALLKRKSKSKYLKSRRPLIVGSIAPLYLNDSIVDTNKINDDDYNIENTTIKSIYPSRNYVTKRLDFYLRKGRSLLVKNLLSDKKVVSKLNKKTYAYYAAMLSNNYFFNGRDLQSIEWGEKALKYYSEYLPEENITLGLVFWREKDYVKAAQYFDNVVKHKDAYSSFIVSRAAYWSARCYLKMQDFTNYYNRLKLASNYYYDFYGILASEELGVNPNYNWDVVNLSNSSVVSLLNDKHGRRALALLQFGITDWAGQELILLAKYDINREDSNTGLNLIKAITYLAQSVPIPMLGIRLAGVKGALYGLGHMAYPILDIENSNNSYEIDPLLVMAVVRRESQFDSRAKSTVGALGLMQLMPSTAKMLLSKYTVSSKYSIKSMLLNPNLNLSLGQKYLKMLLDNSFANNNLIYSLAGYNAGLLNVVKWRREKFRNYEDPLFFIESIPFSETKMFVKKVLTNYWIYQITIKVKPSTALNIIGSQNPVYKDPSDKYMDEIVNFNYNINNDNNIPVTVTYDENNQLQNSKHKISQVSEEVYNDQNLISNNTSVTSHNNTKANSN